MNTILIADRELRFRQQIKRQIGERPDFRVVAEASNGYEALRYLHALEPDVLFLDVQLIGNNTFELLERATYIPKIIYTAPNESYALKAFDYHALDYLVKPYAEPRLEVAISKILDQTPERNPKQDILSLGAIPSDHLFVTDGDRMKCIHIQDIMYLKAARDYTVIFTNNSEYISSSGIGNIAQKLSPTHFIRVHRSYIINLQWVDYFYREIGRACIIMQNGQEIIIGKNYFRSIRALIL